MKTIRFMILILVSMTLFACSFGGNNGSTTRAELEDREKFLREYGVIFGTYEGTISNRPSEVVELGLYSVPVPDGEDERGQPRLKLVAKGRLRWLNSTQPDVFLSVRYLAETGGIDMTNDTPPATENGIVASVAAGNTFVIEGGTVRGEWIEGPVVKNGGFLGNLRVRLKSRDSRAPSEGDIEERNERLRRVYQPLTGNFTGVAKFGGSESLKFYMSIYIAEGPLPDGTSGPILLSYYRRFDDPSGVLELTFDCDYSTQTTTPSITMVSRPYTNPDAANYRISIDAQIRNLNTITGSFQQYHQGRTGEVVITRMKKGGVIPPKK